MTIRDWMRPPRAVLILFVGLIAVCSAGLGWLGWQVLDQDRVVERDRRRERLEHAAGAIANAIQLQLLQGDLQVRGGGRSGYSVHPQTGLLFVSPPAMQEAIPAGVFAAGEALEFSAHPESAAAAYLELARDSARSQIRAEALVRAARVLRRERRWTEALAAYQRLAQLNPSPAIAGIPAALVASGGVCSVLSESGRSAELRLRALQLWEDLHAGRWPVTREVLHTYLEEVRGWLLPDVPPIPPDWGERYALAEAVQLVQQMDPGRRFLLLDGHPAAFTRETGVDGDWSAAVTGPATWRRLWKRLETDHQVRLLLSTPDSALLWGTADRGAPGSQQGLQYAVAGLPLHITVEAGAASPSHDDLTARRRSFLLAGLGIFGLLIAGGALFIARAIHREFAVVRMQSDFVAAVSHEFRTPLTSIRQLTELLAKGRIRNEEQTQKAYELMLSESERLTRLVESILDFGRIQSGNYKFCFEPTPAGEWIQQVVRDFQNATGLPEVGIAFSGSARTANARIDREAMRGALWNLLDNAVKYSPDEKRVEVEVREEAAALEIRVRDHGMGISRGDLRHIFERFYRGAEAKSAGAKGTGIGLALVKEIVEAHGGTVFAESAPGQGSTFTILLPRETTA